MKHFVFTFSENARKAHCEYTATVYVIERNKPRLVGTMTASFVSRDQLVMAICETHAVLPKKCFARHENSGSHRYSLRSLQEEGIAAFHQL